MKRYSGWQWALPSLSCVSMAWILLGCAGGGGSGGGGGFVAQGVINNLNFPTTIRFAPDGRLFFTEKNTGNVRVIENGVLLPQPFATVPVATAGEQGLVGMVLDPDFANNHFVYVFYSRDTPATQRIARFTDVNSVGTNFTVIVDDLPRGTIHNSGRMAFGLDGKLYVTQGEVGDPANAQTTANLAGKVLRYNPDGTIPEDNPDPGSPIYTLGHRNSYGLAVFPGTGTLYASENGPDCDDEINRLVPTGNYGWRPGQPCGDTTGGFIQPLRRYSSIVVPTGITFYNGPMFPSLQGDLLMACFGEGTLRRLKINDNGSGSITSESILLSGLGGVTDVTTDASGNVFVCNTNSIMKMVQAP